MQKSEVSDQIYCMYKNNSTAFWKKALKKYAKKYIMWIKYFFKNEATAF